MRNKDLCPMFCQGREFEIPTNGCLRPEDLIINQESNRKWYFSIVGNNPENPKIALVGLCPAFTQLNKLIDDYNEGNSFQEAAKSSGFNKMSKNIAKMLRKIGIDRELGIEIDDDFDFNNSPYFYTTSLVKCASMKEGPGRSNDYKLLRFRTSKLCLMSRFVSDILNPRYRDMQKIIIFGKKGETALREPIFGEESIKGRLERNGKIIIFLLHPSTQNTGRINEFINS